jgi:hypothetical protein
MSEPNVVFDKGNYVRFTATFEGEPSAVFFSYLRPGVQKPFVDEGYGHPESKIMRLSLGVYLYIIDTTGFPAGVVEWHFWAEGEAKGSKYGKFEVAKTDPRLL